MKIYDPVGSFLSKTERQTLFPEEYDLFFCQDHEDVSYDLYPYKNVLVSIAAFKLQLQCLVCGKELSNPSKEEWPDWIFEIGAGHVMHIGRFYAYDQEKQFFTIKEELCLEGSIKIDATVTAPISHFQPFTRKDSPLWESHIQKMREEDECLF